MLRTVFRTCNAYSASCQQPAGKIFAMKTNLLENLVDVAIVPWTERLAMRLNAGLNVKENMMVVVPVCVGNGSAPRRFQKGYSAVTSCVYFHMFVTVIMSRSELDMFCLVSHFRIHMLEMD